MSRSSRAVVVALSTAWAASVALVAADAGAWGIGPPAGPAGAALTCTGGDDPETEEEEADRLEWQVSAVHGLTSTDLTFSNEEEADLRRRAISVSLERRLGDRWAIRAGGGASLGGDVTIGGDRYEFSPGWLASLGGSFRILDGSGMTPFLLVGLSGAVSSVQAERPGEEAAFTAVDVRGSATVGKIFWGGIAPYAVARVFGGPVFWERHGEEITGSDDYHFQLGAGLLATAEGRFSGFFEIIPLGELSTSVGASVSF